MKAMVTGGGGFLGRRIVDKLLSRGDDVSLLGRSDYPDLKGRGVVCIKADVADRDAVLKSCKGIDVVFHTAAIAAIWGRPDDFYGTNVKGTQNVIDACIENGVKKLVYTSSPSVVYDGKDQIDIDEDTPYPDEYLALYPKTKAEAEKSVLGANGRGGLFTVSLRPHLIWGPGDTNLIPRLIDRARSGKLAIVGDGKNMVDTVYVDNAADAHLSAAQRLEEGSAVAGSRYFITQGEPVNCWEWINEILAGFGLPPVKKRISLKAAYAIGAAMEAFYKVFGIYSEPRMTRFLASQLATSHTYNIDRAKKELGYFPAVSTDQGMKALKADKRLSGR